MPQVCGNQPISHISPLALRWREEIGGRAVKRCRQYKIPIRDIGHNCSQIVICQQETGGTLWDLWNELGKVPCYQCNLARCEDIWALLYVRHETWEHQKPTTFVAHVRRSPILHWRARGRQRHISTHLCNTALHNYQPAVTSSLSPATHSQMLIST